MFFSTVAKVLAAQAFERKVLAVSRRDELTVLLELFRVYPSALMLKSLSVMCQSSLPTLTRSVERLERLGLIERQHGHDKRAKYYCLSKRGVIQMRQYLKQFEALL